MPLPGKLPDVEAKEDFSAVTKQLHLTWLGVPQLWACHEIAGQVHDVVLCGEDVDEGCDEVYVEVQLDSKLEIRDAFSNF